MKANDLDEPEKRKRKPKKYNRFGKPVFEVSKLGKNNFVNQSLVIPYVRMKTPSFIIKGTKEDGSPNYEKNIAEVEYLTFTKVFHVKELMTDVINLSLRAKELYLFILYSMKSSEDHIAIARKQYMELHNIKAENTYLAAVKELSKENFITPTIETKDVFWINPWYFFSGNRLKKYAENKLLINEQPKQEE